MEKITYSSEGELVEYEELPTADTSFQQQAVFDVVPKQDIKTQSRILSIKSVGSVLSWYRPKTLSNISYGYDIDPDPFPENWFEGDDYSHVSDRHFEILNSLLNRIEQIRLTSDEWEREENAEPPSNQVLDTSISIIPLLVINDVIPTRISPTVEEGVCFVFKKEDEVLYLELYNNGEIGLIVENTKAKTIQANQEIESKELIVPILLKWNTQIPSGKTVDLPYINTMS